VTPASHPSLWVQTAPPVPATTDPPPERADIVIVGAGIAGIATALHLARAGMTPVVLEARAVATRASGRNDGQLLLGLGEHYNRIVSQFGAERARALWAFIRDNNQGLKRELARSAPDCELADAGGLRLAETEHELGELGDAARLLAAEGIAHELLDAAKLARVLPPAAGFCGALHLPGEAIVQPVRMVRGLARAALAAGATIHQDCTVAAIRRDQGHDGEATLHLASGRQLRTPIVVLCTSTLARELDDTGFLTKNVFPFRGQILATDELPAPVVAGFGSYAMSSNFCYEYFRAHGRRFVIGGMRWSVKGEELGILDDDTTNPEVTRNLLTYVERHFPALRGVPFPTAWTGIMAGTGDGLPLLGALPGRPGTFVHLAFNGYGLSFAFQGGAVLAEQILHGRSEHPAAGMFAPRRFS
jgi:glycine/D-amino acid oxidase-like deaminating enzyme